MNLLFGILLAILGLSSILVLRSLTTLFHELGHAIPALIFTKQTVTVYIGTYGDIRNSYHFRFGRLQLYFRLNILNWNLGMCTYKGTTLSTSKSIIITLGGPIASLIISIPLLLYIIKSQPSIYLIQAFLVFIIAAGIDFFVNIIPSSSSMSTHDGAVVYNDGLQLLSLINGLFLPKEYKELQQLYEVEKFDELITKADHYLHQNIAEEDILPLLAKVYTQKKQYDNAIAIYEKMNQQYKLNFYELRNIGILYFLKEDYNEALPLFEHCLKKNFEDPTLLNMRAFIKNKKGFYQKAIKDCNAAIYFGQKEVKPYLNRAFAFIQLKKYEQAYQDLNAALNLDKTNPETLQHFGIYYDALGKKEEALAFYKKINNLSL